MNLPALKKACRIACGLGLFAVPGHILAETSTPVLKVQVDPPPLWSFSPENRFVELFATSMREAHTQRGFAWPVAELRSVEDPARAPYLLKIEVTDGRIAGSGNFECTFRASLKTPQGEGRIGTYSNTLWAPSVIYANSGHPFYALSSDAIQALCRDLAGSNLLSLAKQTVKAFARTQA